MKHERMDLREAAHHERECIYDGAGVCCERARAIVDAAVEAHEARCAWNDAETIPKASAYHEMRALQASYDKLRRMERGEE